MSKLLSEWNLQAVSNYYDVLKKMNTQNRLLALKVWSSCDFDNFSFGKEAVVRISLV